MYAVIKTGGKQHKVQAGDVIEVEYLQGGDETLTFQPLLVVDDDGKTHYGKEAERAVVTAKLVGEQKGDKIRVFKYKNKSGYARRAGHRQLMTLIQIEDVSLSTPAKRSTAKTAPKTTSTTSSKAPSKTTSKARSTAADEAADEDIDVEEPTADE